MFHVVILIVTRPLAILLLDDNMSAAVKNGMSARLTASNRFTLNGGNMDEKPIAYILHCPIGLHMILYRV